MQDELVFNRIFEKLDKLDHKIDDLCERTTKVELTLHTHLDTEMKKSEEREKSRQKKFYYINAIYGSVITAYVTFKEFFT